MAFIISIIGNTGVGKTTFAKALAAADGWDLAVEEFEDRPFQQQASDGKKQFIFHNQVDYLLYRAEQEQAIRQQSGVFIIDGGLDLDFNLFSRMFFSKGLLTNPEFMVCSRLYQQFRQNLPMPDLFVYLKAPLEIIRQRKISRMRALDVSKADDVDMGQKIIQNWTAQLPDENLLIIDAENAMVDYHSQVNEIIKIAADRTAKK